MIVPWPIVVAFCFAGMFLFNRYLEGVAVLILLDILYVVNLSDGIGMNELYFTCVGVICYTISIIVKRSLRMYD